MVEWLTGLDERGWWAMTTGKRGYWGKYRGRVVGTDDPLGLGRLLVEVPAVSASPLSWALPCVPYAGAQVGWWMIPPLDASVWVEFEQGDPRYPIWVGCFWQQGELPEAAVGPEVAVIQTPSATLALDPDGARLTVGPATLEFPPDPDADPGGGDAGLRG